MRSSLRANGSRECAPDDRLREAIHRGTNKEWIASSLPLLAMTMEQEVTKRRLDVAKLNILEIRGVTARDGVRLGNACGSRLTDVARLYRAVSPRTVLSRHFPSGSAPEYAGTAVFRTRPPPRRAQANVRFSATSCRAAISFVVRECRSIDSVTRGSSRVDLLKRNLMGRACGLPT